MTYNTVDSENTGICFKCAFFSLRNGKKYILGLVMIKILIIWYIYSQSNDLWSLVPATPSSIGKKNNISLYNVTLFHIPLTNQKGMIPYYVEISTNFWCFLEGINLKTSKSKKNCQCLAGWHGMDCGIPEAVWKSSYLQEGKKKGVAIRRRVMPRRIISAILFINEFDLLDIVVHDTFRAIDVYLVAEENLTYPSPLYTKLKAGFLSEFQDKIMPVSVKNLNGKASNFMHWNLLMLKNLWAEVWDHITDFRPDDIFLFFHVSSILSKDVLMFLKLYDGFPEPFLFELWPVAYDFHRHIIGNDSVRQKLFFTPLGCSFQYLHFICDNNFNMLYNDICFEDLKLKERYQKNFWKIEKWVIGTENYPSGWQCYWCSNINEIIVTLETHPWMIKLFSVPSTFLSNNGTYEFEKIINEGKWFDGSNIDSKVVLNSHPFFAPNIVKSEPLKYNLLLGNNFA